PLKMAVAAFSFGNIMLFSFPEYLGLSASDGDQDFSKLFGYLNLVLALPVLLYSARDILMSAWRGVRSRALNMDVPLSIGILSIFSQSTFEVLFAAGAGYFDSFVGLVLFLLIGRWFQNRTYARISFDRDYRSYFPISANVIVDGKETPTPLEGLEVGDVLMVKHGHLVPADAILISDAALIDYSFVTGEAQLVERQAGDKVFAGGRISGKAIEILLSRKVSNSYLTQLWNEEAFAEKSEEGQVSRISNRMSRVFTMSILTIASLTGAFWLLEDPAKATFAFTSVLIIACPCAIALSIPFTLGEALRLLSSREIFVRDPSVMESLSTINHLVFDKTGTLTETHRSQVDFVGEHPLSSQHEKWLGSLVKQSSHPVSREIAAHLEVSGALEVSHFEEIVGQGIRGEVEGHQIELKAATALRPSTVVSDLYIDGKFCGGFSISRAYRKGLAEIISRLRERYRLSLLSGDHDGERGQLSAYFRHDRDMLFQQSPHDKLRFVAQHQSDGQRVAMVGDGLNDAGALKQSDVGIVISSDHAAFSPACDIIIGDKSFEDLDGLFRFARSGITAIYVCYAVALIYNVVGLSFAVTASLSPIVAAILMPLSSISIVLVGVGLIRYFFHRDFKVS
ncbi:MAG: HAD-IC family P-type ATPase, partial [Saprospiraceae bacterium]|nr:HAD-IC family P-type ATPase [Saprospiraceae bacterium]